MPSRSKQQGRVPGAWRAGLLSAAVTAVAVSVGCPEFDECAPYACQTDADCPAGGCVAGLCVCGATGGDGGGVDGGGTDAGRVDAGTDGGAADAGMDGGAADAGADGGISDAGTGDGGTGDAGTGDGGTGDAGTADAGVDGGGGLPECTSGTHYPCGAVCCEWVVETVPSDQTIDPGPTIPRRGLTVDSKRQAVVLVAEANGLSVLRREAAAWVQFEFIQGYEAEHRTAAAVAVDARDGIHVAYRNVLSQVVWQQQETPPDGTAWFGTIVEQNQFQSSPFGEVALAMRGDGPVVAYFLRTGIADRSVKVVQRVGATWEQLHFFSGALNSTLLSPWLDTVADDVWVMYRYQAGNPILRLVHPDQSVLNIQVNPGTLASLALFPDRRARIGFEQTSPQAGLAAWLQSAESADGAVVASMRGSLIGDPLIQVASDGTVHMVFAVEENAALGAPAHVEYAILDNVKGWVRFRLPTAVHGTSPAFVLDDLDRPHIVLVGNDGLLYYVR